MEEKPGRNRRLQRLARARMRETGEKYTVALRAVKEETEEFFCGSDHPHYPHPFGDIDCRGNQ